jgi:rhodanese-related sulfurtransferase
VSVGLIERDALHEKLVNGEDVVIVDALPPMSYAHSHLPGAINLPPERVDERTTRRMSKDIQIVVYCSGPDCDSSTETAELLVRLGFTNVLHYPGGKNEWRKFDLPLERAGAPYRP